MCHGGSSTCLSAALLVQIAGLAVTRSDTRYGLAKVEENREREKRKENNSLLNCSLEMLYYLYISLPCALFFLLSG